MRSLVIKSIDELVARLVAERNEAHNMTSYEHRKNYEHTIRQLEEMRHMAERELSPRLDCREQPTFPAVEEAIKQNSRGRGKAGGGYGEGEGG